MTVARTLVVKLIGETGPFVTAIEQAAKKAKSAGGEIASGLNDALEKVGKVAAGAAVAGIGAMAGGLALAVKEAADAEKNIAQLDAVLKSTNGAAGVTKDSILELAGALQKTTTFSDDEVISADNLLLTFTNIGQNVFPDATRAVLDMSVALGQDAQASAMQLGKALNDPIKGVTALRKVGVSFTEDQMKQIKAMAAAGDVAGAQTMILKELQKEFGGSAEAAGKTLAGSLTILKNAGLDILETIGTALLPMLTQLAQGLRDALDNPAVQAGIQAIMAAIGQFTSQALPQIISGLQSAVTWVQTNWPLIQSTIQGVFDQINAVVGPIITTIAGTIQATFGAIGTFLQTHGEEIKTFLQNAWETISGIISGVATIIQTVIVSVFGGIRDFINTHGADIQTILKTAWDAVRGIVETVLNIISGIVKTVMAVLRGDWSAAWDGIKNVVETIWNGIKGVVETAGENLKGLLGRVWAGVRQAVETAWNAVKGFISTAWEGIIDFLKTLPDRLFNIGKSIIEGLWNGIKSMFSNVAKGISDFFQNTIDDIKKKLGIQSPSTVFAAMGDQLMRGLALGIGRSAALPQLQLNAALADMSADMTVRASARLAAIAPAAQASTQSASGPGSERTFIYNNYIQDTLAARLLLEQQRQDLLRSTQDGF